MDIPTSRPTAYYFKSSAITVGASLLETGQVKALAEGTVGNLLNQFPVFRYFPHEYEMDWIFR